jgi:hypothetical protein
MPPARGRRTGRIYFQRENQLGVWVPALARKAITTRKRAGGTSGWIQRRPKDFARNNSDQKSKVWENKEEKLTPAVPGADPSRIYMGKYGLHQRLNVSWFAYFHITLSGLSRNMPATL